MTPVARHEFTFIFLHGLQGSAAKYYEKWFKFGTFLPPNCKIVIGNGPHESNRKYPEKKLNSWFNLTSKDFDYGKATTLEQMWKRHDVKELEESADKLLKVVEDERSLVPNADSRRIFIGGQS